VTKISFAQDPRPIGVFDSGVGGLTVLKALIKQLPGQSFIYLGDTARVPYGTKSADTVKTYSLSLARLLLAHDVKMIVIACNTASAHAAEAVAAMALVPVISMVPPAVDAALDATKNNSILLMATQSTVQAKSYENALKAKKPNVRLLSVPAQVLVSLAEEGWHEGDVTEAALDRYIRPAFTGAGVKPDTIILGCTHFPLLKDSIARVAGPDVTLIDTGEAAARHILKTYGPFIGDYSGETRFFVTDSVERFEPLARKFLGYADAPMDVSQIDLTDFSAPQPQGKKACSI
jgi:glutamate racemase